MANALTINDISAVANKVLANAQGRPNETVNTADFTTVAQTALAIGYDPLATAISQVLSRTIFSYRPYTAKFRGLEKDAVKWGNHVRKLNPIDKPLEVDNRIRKDNQFALTDGDSVDQYRINKPEVLQTNFYGSQTYQKSLTIWRDQLDTAFTGPEQFGNFLSMMMGNATDQLTQAREDLARGALVNLIGGTHILGNVWHVLTAYNTETGSTFTATTIMEPGNFADFYRWFVGKLQSIMDRMEERTILNHVNPIVNGELKLIRRHTPKSLQHLYMFSDFVNNAETVANSVTFHDDYLKRIDFEKVTFWQNASTPKAISTQVNYLTAGSDSADSALTTAKFENNSVIGILFDDEAAGINPINQWAQPTPFNARGGYYNQYWHETTRWYNDNTENALVICLD
jgi:hypothetical protein